MRHGPPFFHSRRGYHHGSLKETLLEAARRLIGERGPSGFTLSDAAKLAGVTPAALYRHFTDRSALIGELRQRGFELFTQKLEAAWNDGKPEARVAFERMGLAYQSFAREEPGLYTAMFGHATGFLPADVSSAIIAGKCRSGGFAGLRCRKTGRQNAGVANLVTFAWRGNLGRLWAAVSGLLFFQPGSHGARCGQRAF